MPQLNSRGDVLMGIGSGSVSINGAAIASGAGIGGWFEDDVALYQQGPPYHLEAYDVATKTKHQADPNGANVLFARNGRWAAQLGTTIRTSWSKTYQNMGLLALGEDGSLVVTAVHSAGKPIHVIPLSGAPVVLSTGSCLEIAHEWLGRTVWMDYGGKVFAVGVAVPAITGRPKQVLLIDGEDWLLQVYQDAKLILHPIASTRGYLVNTGNAFTPAARLLNGVTVAWSIGQGERPSDLRTAMIDTTAPRVDLIAAPPPPPPPPPPPEPVPVIPLPRPDALRDLPAFAVGVDFPVNPGTFPMLPPEALVAFRSIDVHAIGIELDYRRPNSEALLVQITDAGFWPIPLLTVWGLNDRKPANLDAAIAAACTTFEVLAARFPWITLWTVENEPDGAGRTPSKMTPAECAKIVDLVGRAVKRGNPAATVFGPGILHEMFNMTTGTQDVYGLIGPSYYAEFRAALTARGGTIDGHTHHPYRNPHPPSYTASRFGSRQAEYAEIVRQAGGLRVIVGEVGYPLSQLPADTIAAYLYEELKTQRALGIPLCCIYCHEADWGLFRQPGWVPNPAALAVKAFLQPVPPPPIEPPPPGEPMTAYDESQILAFQTDVQAQYIEAGQGLDLSNVVWCARMQFDAVTMGYSASRAKHLAALRGALGLPPA